MNLAEILGGVKKAGKGVFAQPQDINSGAANWMLPLAAVIEAGTSGQTGGTQGAIDMLSGLPAAKEDYRQKSLERQLGITKAEGQQKFLKGAAETPENLVDLYSRYGNPEEAAKLKLTSMEKLKQIMSSPQRMTDFQRKYNVAKEAHPDWTEDQLLDYVLVPSSQVGPSGEKIEGARSLSEARSLGTTTEPVIQGAVRKATAVETGTIPPKLSLARGQAAIDVEAAGEKARQNFAIIKEQPKKQIDFVLNLGRKIPAEGRSAGALGAKMNALIGTNPELKSYDDLFNTMVSNMARSYGGEKGVLTDYDIQRMKGFKFSPFDTPKERSYKENYLKVLTGLTPKQEEALKWANDNPGDPRADEIRKQIGIE